MMDLEGNIVDVPNPSGRGSGYRDEEDGVLEKVERLARRRFCLRRNEMEKEKKEKEREFIVHMPLPDEKEIENMVLEKKKMELLSNYATVYLIFKAR
ncbi:hypothetical protein LWI29_031069 [Acer saccharum]|uniref:Uncharacterized protein n=1 Tax=Acer saccharum TaxID=4024 RepID=A0AA39VQX3_ACESA|nr:hypothetical protein LWI29_031069 [Acer saccharum]